MCKFYQKLEHLYFNNFKKFLLIATCDMLSNLLKLLVGLSRGVHSGHHVYFESRVLDQFKIGF